jgi:hypothetical protein
MGSRFVWGRVDNLLFQNGFPTDRYDLGTLSLGKFVQGQVTRPMRFAHICTGPGGVLRSYRVDSHVMLRQQTCAGSICAPSASHPTECKMRRHMPQSQGGQTATEGNVPICAHLRTYGPYAQVGATYVAPAAQLRVRHTGKTLGYHSN